MCHHVLVPFCCCDRHCGQKQRKGFTLACRSHCITERSLGRGSSSNWRQKLAECCSLALTSSCTDSFLLHPSTICPGSDADAVMVGSCRVTGEHPFFSEDLKNKKVGIIKNKKVGIIKPQHSIFIESSTTCTQETTQRQTPPSLAWGPSLSGRAKNFCMFRGRMDSSSVSELSSLYYCRGLDNLDKEREADSFLLLEMVYFPNLDFKVSWGA